MDLSFKFNDTEKKETLYFYNENWMIYKKLVEVQYNFEEHCYSFILAEKNPHKLSISDYLTNAEYIKKWLLSQNDNDAYELTKFINIIISDALKKIDYQTIAILTAKRNYLMLLNPKTKNFINSNPWFSEIRQIDMICRTNKIVNVKMSKKFADTI